MSTIHDVKMKTKKKTRILWPVKKKRKQIENKNSVYMRVSQDLCVCGIGYKMKRMTAKKNI